MLSASTLTQMPPSGEDSSGSDRGSEVSVPAPATETDRYGFILGNGSTVGSEGPPPELIRQRETKWINIISQWDRVLLKKSSKVKEQCQKGIPASLRAKCWPLLCGATKRMHHNKDLYETLDSRPALQSCVDVIERDLDRQFPFHEMFLSRDGHGQRGLFRVLKAFTQLKPEEGYCQAQGPVAAVLLMNMPPEEAFWCLVQISEQYLPGYYSPLLEGVLFDAAMLTWVLKKMCPATHKHLQRHGVEPLMFATDWLMCLFTRHLPFNTLLRVWDLFFCYGVRVLFQVAVVLVRRALGRVEQREECEGQMETLERLRGVREQVQQEDDTFIAEVCSVPLSGKDLERQTEKELEKWMKERPASTFDPRGRCHGYRMAWARAREREEERNRKEREKENMSLPPIRLPFLLSLSPSLLRKRWERGSKTDTGEWEGGGREGRKVSEEVWEERSEGGNLRRGSEMDGSPVRAQGVPLSATEDREPVEPREPFEHKEPSEQDRTQKTQLTPDSARVASQQCELTSDPIVTSQGQAEEQGGLSQSQETNHSKDTMETQEVLNKQSTESARIITEHIVTETKGKAEKRKETETHAEAKTEEETVTEIQIHTEAKTEEEMEAEVQKGQHTDKSVATETDMGSKTETQTDVNTDTETDMQQEADIKFEAETDMGSLTETERDKETNTETHTDKEIEARTETQSYKGNETETHTDKKSEAEREAEVEAHRETEVEAHTETEVEAHTETEVEAHTETEVEAHTETEVEAHTETEVEAHTETEVEGENESAMHIEADTRVEADLGSQMEAETHTETEKESEIEVPVYTGTETRTEEATDTSTGIEQATDTNTEIEEATDTSTGIEEATDTNTEIEEATDTSTGIEAVTASPNEIQTHTETASKTEVQYTEPSRITPANQSQVSPELTSAAEPEGETDSSDQTGQDQKIPEEPQSPVTIHPEENQETPNIRESEGEKEEEVLTFPSQEASTDILPPLHQGESLKADLLLIPGNPKSQSKSEKSESPPPADSKAGSGNLVSTHSDDSSQRTPLCDGSSATPSGDFRLCKSGISQKLTRRLSEDLFTDPNQSQPTITHSNQSNTGLIQYDQPQPNTTAPIQVPKHPESPRQVTGSIPGTVPPQTGPKPGRGPTDTPRRFGLFRRLKGEQPKQDREKGEPKVPVPKILIQDFSDGTGEGRTVRGEEEEELSSRERRRRRREQERREKEEEKLRKKRQKEMEKEEKERKRERRKPQTRGKSFQVQHNNVPLPGNSGSQTFGSKRNSTPSMETYF
ncbi:zinc finger CCCH domain-containing protein 13 [Coregonus clupeaformis]|uniref:zinc finger CCCH domain-containing protein 13 n=1 Tax=Coregonus clupeaformis TaxID=59861 RepID=UPI001E1C733A|nr:zinc finger CCCH domain-containing protein 13 [Coregonus clupeaformis]